MLTQIYHKQNEIFETEFFKDKECTQLITDWSEYENAEIYIKLKDGNITPLLMLPREISIYTPYLLKEIKEQLLGIFEKDCTSLYTLDDITPNLSKYIPEDNAVLFLSEEEYNESKISFQNHKIFCHQTGCYGSFEIMDCYNSNVCYSESALKYKKLTIFLQHITQETIQKANEVAKELKEKYGVEEVNLFGLHCFCDIDYIRKTELLFLDKSIQTRKSRRLEVIDCFDIFQDHLKENN